MKGILFTEILFHKVVDKTKTQTRRGGKSLAVVNENPDYWVCHGKYSLTEDGVDIDEAWGFTNTVSGSVSLVKSRYKIGEVLYLKENTATYEGETVYMYGRGIFDFNTKDGDSLLLPVGKKLLKWSNKLFMGLDKARYFVKVTDVRIERLFDISDNDCLAEGVERIDVYIQSFMSGYTRTPENGYIDYMSKEPNNFDTPQESYFSLYRFANKIPKSKGITNDWVWVYDFVFCDREGNEI